MTTAKKCLLILSTRRAGSSALQAELIRSGRARHCQWTRHFENETLYWIKAAALLGLAQTPMADSEIPMSSQAARRDLLAFLRRNLGGSYDPPGNDRELVFDGWRRLCDAFGPVFVEKSPHHLLQTSALSLIEECVSQQPDTEFMLVGLVRNPMAVVYSTWRGWCGSPEKNELEWLQACRNLLELRGRPGIGERVVILRYEDMVAKPGALGDVRAFVGDSQVQDDDLHSRSLDRWKRDRRFGFELSDEVREFAEREFGYSEEAMANQRVPLWPIHRRAARLLYLVAKRPYRFLRRKLTGRVSGR